MYNHILVTGGAGFAGSSLCLAIRRSLPSVQVTALDNLRRRGSELIVPLLRQHDVPFVHGDVRNPTDLTLAQAPDLIIECSAEPSAQAGYGGSPEYLIHTNLTGCFHCLELARTVKADFIFLSTSRVYPYNRLNEIQYLEEDTRYSLLPSQQASGVSERGISERFTTDGARSLYGMTKLAAELMVEEYADAYSIRCIVDRLGLLTGPRQMAKSDQGVIALWVMAHYYGKKLSYIGFGGTGKQVRDFLHVEDFCDLVVDQIQNFELYQGRRFNVGGGLKNSLSLLETTRLCEEVMGRRIEIGSVAANRPADVRSYITDTEVVRSVNGWSPRRDALVTLQDIHQWLQAGGKPLRNILEG